MDDRERRLEEMGYPIDRVPAPGAIYRPVSVIGSVGYVSGAVPMDGDRLASQGRVASEVSVESAQQAAALCAANNLRMAAHALGGLSRIISILRLTGYVNSDPDFAEQHIVINGASQLLLDVFGDAGLAARTAIGVAQLPLGSSTETEMILALQP